MILLLSVLLLGSCQKKPGPEPPVIRFKTDSGFISQNATIPVGMRVQVGIEAMGDETNLTFFHIGLDDGKAQTFLDSGMNQIALMYDMTITKTASEAETWEFLVMDRNRNFNSIALTLSRDSSSHYGPIRTYSGLLLGAQENQSTGSFLSLTANRVYFLDDAYHHQDSIDMLYYFDLYDATLSSPAETDAPAVFTGPAGIANWAIKNETRYDTTGITPAAFALAHNDSLILSAYEPANLKRKAKFLQPGMVVSFRSPDGKLGLIHIRELVPGEGGQVLMDIQIQR